MSICVVFTRFLSQSAYYEQCKVDYNDLINHKEFIILYHFFSRVKNMDSWIEICRDLGFNQYFGTDNFEHLYNNIRNLVIRAKESKEQNRLRFFMQLIIFYWDNLTEYHPHDKHSEFIYFWIQTISRMIKVCGVYASDIFGITHFCISFNLF